MQQAIALTELLIEMSGKKQESTKLECSKFYLAISGGSSVKTLFALWVGEFLNKIPWNTIELFWVDERCVSPTDIESNYGNAKNNLLDLIHIPPNQVHRIRGEEDPVVESLRYSKLVEELLPSENGIPIFDFIILGIGEDGHTSSIFPGQDNLLSYQKAFSPSVNPYSGQKRIAMTGLPIINADLSAFYLSGESKKQIMENIFKSDGDSKFPAGYLINKGKNSRIYFDLK